MPKTVEERDKAATASFFSYLVGLKKNIFSTSVCDDRKKGRKRDEVYKREDILKLRLTTIRDCHELAMIQCGLPDEWTFPN